MLNAEGLPIRLRACPVGAWRVASGKRGKTEKGVLGERLAQPEAMRQECSSVLWRWSADLFECSGGLCVGKIMRDRKEGVEWILNVK